MDLSLILQNAWSVVGAVGLPVVVLLILATEMGKWYDAHTDPPPEAFREDEHH